MTLKTETTSDEPSSSEFLPVLVVAISDDAGGILMVFAGALSKAVDEGDGLRPERQSQNCGDEEIHASGRRAYWGNDRFFLINTGYQLVCYLVMGAILAAWN